MNSQDAPQASLNRFLEAKTGLERAISKCDSDATRGFLERMLAGVDRQLGELQAASPDGAVPTALDSPPGARADRPARAKAEGPHIDLRRPLT